MKSKSSHHKNQNTFKFQTFSERLSNINIDVARRLGKFSATPEDADTFFAEALERWIDANLTQHFVDFRREISKDVQSLPQLVHHQNAIVEALQAHLKIKDSLAIQALLDLTVQMARDLQGDFYPFFEQFFHTLVWLLNTYHHDVEVLEHTFRCLAHLFKFLWRHMLKDIQNVFRLFAPLLSTRYREYIHTFASESFAFLMRKHRDPGSLFDFMFDGLDQGDDIMSGVGQLLFEMIKGIKQQFHSSTPQVLPILLSKLGMKKLPWQHVHDSIVTMFQAMATHTVIDHCVVVWQVLLQVIQDVYRQLGTVKSKQQTAKVQHLTSLLSLLHILVDHSHGSIISCQDLLVETLCQLLQSSCLHDDCAALCLKNITSLILAEKCRLDSQHRPRLVNLVYRSTLPRHHVMDFTATVFGASLFEQDLLPGLLGYCHSCLQSPDGSSDVEVLGILTKLIQYRLPADTGVMRPHDLKRYTLEFTNIIRSRKAADRKQTFPALLLQRLEEHHKPETPADLSLVWAVLVCLPHVRPLEEDDFCPHLARLTENLLQYSVEDPGSRDDVGRHLCVLRETTLVWYSLLENKARFFEELKADRIQQLINCYPDDVDCLRTADLYITAAKTHAEDVLTEQLFMGLFEKLQNNFSAPFSQVRLLTTHILAQFDLQMPALPEGSTLDQIGLFRICLEAEQTPVSVQTYREKLRHLRKLSHDLITCQLPVGPFEQVGLHYLSAMLYVNLTLIWKPVMELIESHAVGLGRDGFWSVYGRLLEDATQHAERERLILPDEISSDESAGDLDDLLTSYMEKTSTKSDRPDYLNYRDHLWRAMQLFPEVCEPKSKIVSPLLFRFLENEYYPSDLNLAPSQNISRKSPMVIEDDEPDPDLDQSQTFTEFKSMDTSQSDGGAELVADLSDGEFLDTPENSSMNKGKRSSIGGGTQPSVKRKRANDKTFADILTVFSKFKNPKSIYLEPRLTELYFQLLHHRDATLQKIAFECMMTYNHKYLVPYRENFERLMDDKSFKNEIILFSIDEATTVVKSEHREGLLPVLLRILYGKMQTKTGTDSSGRSNSQFRKSIILRFLGGSQQHEIKIFLDMVFEPFKGYLTGSIRDRVKEVMDSADPTNIIPLRKLQGALNTIDLVTCKLGSLLEVYLPHIIQLVSCIGGLCTSLLARRDSINSKSVNMVKTVRNAAINRINQIYVTFDYYKFSFEETQVFFDIAVWPQLEKLPFEGIYNATPLLKLLNSWTENRMFFPLLGMVHPDNPSVAPLPYVFQLLNANHVKPGVITMVINMVERLLTTDDEEPSAGEPGLPYGIQLLLPHVDTILIYLKKVAQRLSGSSERKKSVPARELNILSRLSEHVSNREQSAEIVHLLLPFLGRNVKRSAEVEVDVLTAISHLIHQVEQPEQFLHCLAKLFSVISARSSRISLCAVLKSIAESVPSVMELSLIVNKLNSWDRRRMEEPDYMLRLTGFEEANKLLEQSPDVTVMLILLHNCCFFLANIDDMSLRDSSSYCIQKLLEKLTALPTDTEMFRLIVRQNLLPEIKDKLKHNKEVVRHEYINLLGSLVRTFPTYDLFTDLAKLYDSTDVEVDFFKNIVHIQQHRRARALRRVVRQMSTSKFDCDTLILYLLPISTMFIRDEIYAKAGNLHDASVEAVGAICRQLPWKRYMRVLQYFLARLTKSIDNQKLAVRLVVSILDAFHFDLRNSTGVRAVHVASKQDSADANAPKNNTKNLGKQKDAEEEESKETSEKELLEEIDGADDTMAVDKDNDSSDEDVVPTGGGTEVTLETNQICPMGLANTIHKFIVRTIIPELHKTLTQKAKSEDEHKKAQPGKYAEDDEILRVPLALAMVKLLQNLPRGSLENNLPGILIKVCHFLRSRSQDIRETSRDTLNQIMQSLGPKYFYYIVREMRGALTRGYQKHVLCYTVWALMKNAAEAGLKTGDLDSCVAMLVEIFNEELFGQVAEEKEVEGITGKLFEARSSKSYDSYGIMAKYVSKDSIDKVVKPLIQILQTSSSHRKAGKVSEVLHKVSFGLIENSGLKLSVLLSFVHAVTTETMPQMLPKETLASKKGVKPGARPPSTYLLPPEPGRGGIAPKILAKSNMYIVVEFGLQVMHNLLKRSMLISSNTEHLGLIDPFMAPLTTCLASKHNKVTTISLRCLLWLLKWPLPALKDHIESITNHLFILLSNYAAAGAAEGDNFELTVICFKAMTVLVRDVHYHTINTGQLQVLLGYAEQDIHDFSRQATAFTLLKAILSRKLVVKEMESVIRKVQELSITSETPHVRLQCRQVVLQYLLDYPLGQKLQYILEFYVRQLEFEHEAGRESALEMLAKIFSDFPQVVLTKHSGLFFLPLSSRLINDESSRCQKKTYLAIKTLLSRLDSSDRDNMFNMCVQWLNSEDLSIQKLAAKTCGIFVEVECSAFERHLEVLLPILSRLISPEKYPEETYSLQDDRDNDRYLFTLLNLFMKICRDCDIIRKPAWAEHMNILWAHVQSHLLYPHSWVRLCSAQLFGQLFAAWTPEELVATSREYNQHDRYSSAGNKKKRKKEIDTETKTLEYLIDFFQAKLHGLCGVFCKQLASPVLEQDLADQIVKNLLFMAKILKLMPENEKYIPEAEDEAEDTINPDNADTNTKSGGVIKKASFRWLTKSMCREARIEASVKAKQIIKRTSVFKWLAAVSLDLGEERIDPYLSTILHPLVREVTDASTNLDPVLKQLSQEVLDLIKTTASHNSFTKTYAAVQMALSEKREGRKRQRAMDVVANPELGAKRKIKKNLTKKESKKRRIEEFKPFKKKMKVRHSEAS